MEKYFNMGLDIASLVFGSNPIANIVIGTVKAVIKKKDDGISNESVVKTIEEMAKSTWNELSQEKVSYIAKIVSMPKEKFNQLEKV